MSDISAVKALVFDVFGTVVDWRSSLIADFTKWGEKRGITADWTALVDGWRAVYAASMDVVRKNPQTRDVDDGLPLAGIDWKLDVDKAEAAKYGASPVTVGTAVQLVQQEFLGRLDRHVTSSIMLRLEPIEPSSGSLLASFSSCG